MKNIILFISLIASVFASEHYSKAEPYRFYTLQSNVSGLVVHADEKLEGKKLSNQEFIIIDDDLDKKELKLLQNKKVNYEKSLKLNIKMSENYLIIIEKKSKNYDRIKDLPIKSSVEKDKEFFDLSSTINLQLSSLEKIETIHANLSDINFKTQQLERNIKDKHLKAKDKILYKLHVEKGQVVSKGMNLAELADVRKAKLTIFLNADDLATIDKKVIYLNDKKTSYKIDKIWTLSDTEHISSYRCEILINAPKQFSKLYKIEFMD